MEKKLQFSEIRLKNRQLEDEQIRKQRKDDAKEADKKRKADLSQLKADRERSCSDMANYQEFKALTAKEYLEAVRKNELDRRSRTNHVKQVRISNGKRRAEED